MTYNDFVFMLQRILIVVIGSIDILVVVVVRIVFHRWCSMKVLAEGLFNSIVVGVNFGFGVGHIGSYWDHWTGQCLVQEWIWI